MERLIEHESDIEEGLKWLFTHEPRFKDAYQLTGKLDLRRSEQGFTRLLHAIVGQQLSVAAAATIWDRVSKAGLTSATAIENSSDEAMRALGLSRQKISYARSLAAANINFSALPEMPSQTVISELTKVKGIGNWTAEIYAMFSLGRADVFAHEDLALQEATKILLELDERPRGKKMIAIAEQWSPWRAVAARLLWAFYGVQKGRQGVNN